MSNLATPEEMEIEKMANKLFEIFNGAKTESVYDNRTRWIAVAKYIKENEGLLFVD